MVSFIILGSVAETYLTPVLTKISEALNMSEAISGVTLLAFANGAPDILASISAAGEENGIYIVVGNLFGACLFATTLVIGRCIGVCPKPIQMESVYWNRDLIFYIISLLMVVVYGCFGKINLVLSASFFVVYLIYIGVVIFVRNYKFSKFTSKKNTKKIMYIVMKRSNKSKICTTNSVI